LQWEKISEEKITECIPQTNPLFFNETAGKVRHQHSRHGSREEQMDYLEFIARIIGHLKLTFEAARPPPLHNVQQELLYLYAPALCSMGPGRMKWLNLQELGSKTASIST